MKLYEWCAIAEIPLTIDCSYKGYTARIGALGDGGGSYEGHWWGVVEDGREHYDGGTTWTCGHGKTPDEAARNLCTFIAGKLNRFGAKQGYRHVRAPEELVP